MAAVSDRLRRARPLLGTFVEVEASGAAHTELVRAIDTAFDAVASVHRLMSFHEADSDVSRLNREAFDRPVEVHAWTFRVLEASVALHRQSNGIFDVAIAPALQQMGLLPQLAHAVPVDGSGPVFDAVELLEGQRVRFRHRQTRIDLGGIAKGFAVDRALEALRGFDALDGGLVNAGGDLAAFGAGIHPIHIRHPRDPARSVCRIDVSDAALASTARRFDPFRSAETSSSAVIDPTGKPSSNTIDGVTMRAPSCMIADALTKVVMISGPDAASLLELYGASALVISADGSVQMSPGWQHSVHLAA